MGAQQATPEELEKARQVLAYALKEVSVVDRPANKRPFAILKRDTDTEDQKMSAFITEDQVLDTLSADVLDQGTEVNKNDDSGEPENAGDDTGADTQEGAEDPKPEGDEQVAVKKMWEAHKALIAEKVEAMKAVVEKFASGGAMSADEIDKATHAMSQLAWGIRDLVSVTSVMKGTGPIEEFASWLKEAAKADGAPREAISQVAKILSEMKTPEAPAAEGDPDPEPEVPTVQVFDDGRVIVSGARVDKAVRFTQGRTKKIAETITSLVKLLQEVDEEAFKSFVSTLSKAHKAEGGEPQAEPAAATEAPETKPADGKGEELEAVKKELAEVKKKLGEVESARAPSKAADGDGTDGATPVKKNEEGGLWDGVLWSK